MSDRMEPLNFSALLHWILKEFKQRKTIFGVHTIFRESSSNFASSEFGPAAGPNTQLAQNIVTCYACGARVIELKTVQTLDGPDLIVEKPCIYAKEEGYNSEWSTELFVTQAYEEYVKAWILIHVIEKEFHIGSCDQVRFIMSAGYTLDQIKSEKLNTFIDGMVDASESEFFKECIRYLLSHKELFQNLTENDIRAISPQISNCVTLSTLHGCPAHEIEDIASYLLTEKKLHTYVKCNPTLLGYEKTRQLLDTFGYRKLLFTREHFDQDLKFEEAVSMFGRLKEKADEFSLTFGVKVSNTFPVFNTEKMICGKEIYLSGKALLPLAITAAMELSGYFDGMLPISFSGGADLFTITDLLKAGIHPVTMATTILKPGGYQRFTWIAEQLNKNNFILPKKIDASLLDTLMSRVQKEGLCDCSLKKRRKKGQKKNLPMFSCGIAPCKEACPLGQNITGYLRLLREKRYEDAFSLIIKDNPLPFITGEICSHPCMENCNRQYYDQPVDIRACKLKTAKKAFERYMEKARKVPVTIKQRAAVIGAGPSGLACAYFLRTNGMDATIFEKEPAAGGKAAFVIPEFRISKEAIDSDLSLIKASGVNIITDHKVTSFESLKQQYDYVIIAAGTNKHQNLSFPCVNAIDFLYSFHNRSNTVPLGEKVAVIGGGNTALDAARAAIRMASVKEVYLIYRRTAAVMPALEEEIKAAVFEGIILLELLSPVAYENGKLICERIDPAFVSQSLEKTGETVSVAVDTVIAAIGEKSEIKDEEKTGCYVIGDALTGPSTIADAIASARKTADEILSLHRQIDTVVKEKVEKIYMQRGLLLKERREEDACLHCDEICELCAEVCPNRANVVISDQNQHQILHIDRFCNECGNCKVFCPYDDSPYEKKLTLFSSKEAMEDSSNTGFYVVNKEQKTYVTSSGTIDLETEHWINVIFEKYSYLIS